MAEEVKENQVEEVKEKKFEVRQTVTLSNGKTYFPGTAIVDAQTAKAIKAAYVAEPEAEEEAEETSKARTRKK